MQQAGNPNIHVCPPRKINFSKLNALLEISHASVYVNEEGKITYQKIIAAEYSFEIFSDQPKTIIKVLKPVKRFPGDHSSNKKFEFQELITINAVVDLPWHNYPRVRESVKTYIVFS